MKLSAMYLISIIAMACLFGCAGKKMEPTTTVYDKEGNRVVTEDPLVGLERERQAAVKECRLAMKEAAEQGINCAGLSDDKCFMLQLQAENRKLFTAIAGKDPCAVAGAGLFDYKIREVEEMNATARSATGNILDLGKWIVGGDVVKAGIDKMGDSINQHVGGDGSPSASTSREEINNDETSTSVGDESPPSTSGVGGGLSGDTVSTEPVTTEEPVLADE